MKNCNEYAALLDLYADGELSTADMIRVQEHLALCPVCQAYVDDALAIRAAFPDAEDTVVPPDFTAKVMDAVRKAPRRRGRSIPWSKVLAPLAACFALFIVLHQSPIGGYQTKLLTKSAAPATEEAAAEQVLADSVNQAAPVAQEEMKAAMPEPESAPEAPAEEAPATELFVGSTSGALTMGLSPAEGTEPESKKEHDTMTVAAEFLSVLFLPPEAATLLQDFTPTAETETEISYQLLKADCERLEAQLKEAGISYMAEDAVTPTSNVSLVILSK